MSQQKMFFALVLVAGCVALASGQSMDVNQCTSGAQQLVSDYMKSTQSSFEKFTSTLAQQGANQMDIQKLNTQFQQILKELQGMVNTNGFNVEQIRTSGMKVFTMYTEMLMQSFNPSTAMTMGRAYMEFIQTSISGYTSLTMNIAQACVPQLRDNRVPSY